MMAGMKHRNLLPLMTLALIGAALSACGFRPLYGTHGVQRASVQADMGDIEISQIANRNGQILRNALIDKITPNGQPTNAAYQLSIKLGESKVPLGIRKDATATRANMTQTAAYVLIDRSSSVAVDRGTVQAITSYDIVNSDFGTIMAERDARKRGIDLLADSITLRVALYFNRRTTLTARPAARRVKAINRK